MTRTAEYSIKGYLYQFLCYLSEILAADDGTKITIEGAIEDVDVAAEGLTTAIQCKYHERAGKYTLGRIYKPILLMLEHYSNISVPETKVQYRLFCHFPSESGTKTLTKEELGTVLTTNAGALKAIAARIDTNVDLEAFLERFVIEFGPSVEDLQLAVMDSLKDKGFDHQDVDALIFPNAIQRIVDLATGSGIEDRSVDPGAFLGELRQIRQVTFTRWTRELATRAKIFARLREDLKHGLRQNARSRVFVIDPSDIEDFESDIVQFIKKFTQIYSSKFLHSDPPLFMFTGGYDVDALQLRLYAVGLHCQTGKVGNTILVDELFRRPIRVPKPLMMQFHLRIASRNLVVGQPPRRPDELFLINVADDEWEHEDINVYSFEIDRLADLEYVLQIRSKYA